MSFSVSEFNPHAGGINRIVNYFDIPITTGQRFDAFIPAFSIADLNDTTAAASSTIYTLAADTTIILPTEDLSGTQIAIAFFNVDAIPYSNTQGIVFGSGFRQRGTYAVVTAIPHEGYKFLGWYVNNVVFISGDAVYRFRVMYEINLVARFTSIPTECYECDYCEQCGQCHGCSTCICVYNDTTFLLTVENRPHGVSPAGQVPDLPIQVPVGTLLYPNGLLVPGMVGLDAAMAAGIDPFVQFICVQITLNATGGTVVPSSIDSLAHGFEWLPIPTRADYEFVGWYSAETGKIPAGGELHVPIVGGSPFHCGYLTLYALWEKTASWPIVYITLNANGGIFKFDGSHITTEVRVAGEPVDELPTPTRLNYDFVGWYTALTGGVRITELSIVPSFNVIYYARWVQTTPNWTFLGWTTDIEALENFLDNWDETTVGRRATWADAVSANIITAPGTMPRSNLTVYAIWGNGDEILRDTTR